MLKSISSNMYRLHEVEDVENEETCIVLESTDDKSPEHIFIEKDDVDELIELLQKSKKEFQRNDSFI